MQTILTATASLVACCFAAELEGALGQTRFVAMKARNAAIPPNSGICASHDFCDANLVMDSAFMVAFNSEEGADLDDSVNETGDFALWNAAWSIAREHRLI